MAVRASRNNLIRPIAVGARVYTKRGNGKETLAFVHSFDSAQNMFKVALGSPSSKQFKLSRGEELRLAGDDEQTIDGSSQGATLNGEDRSGSLRRRMSWSVAGQSARSFGNLLVAGRRRSMQS